MHLNFLKFLLAQNLQKTFIINILGNKKGAIPATGMRPYRSKFPPRESTVLG
jgi:hypothetical protein